MNILDLSLIILSVLLLYLFVINLYKQFNKKMYNHVDARYYVDKTVIAIDRFTAHRLIFNKQNKYISLRYNNIDDNYTLIVSHFSLPHKEEILKEIGL